MAGCILALLSPLPFSRSYFFFVLFLSLQIPFLRSFCRTIFLHFCFGPLPRSVSSRSARAFFSFCHSFMLDEPYESSAEYRETEHIACQLFRLYNSQRMLRHTSATRARDTTDRCMPGVRDIIHMYCVYTRVVVFGYMRYLCRGNFSFGSASMRKFSSFPFRCLCVCLGMRTCTYTIHTSAWVKWYTRSQAFSVYLFSSPCYFFHRRGEREKRVTSAGRGGGAAQNKIKSLRIKATDKAA